ncbi:15532_t:CDS:2 [Entrophospora sp. SA101]|nr:15532_t:CDS:2 [Entrophospora sp. SA101]
MMIDEMKTSIIVRNVASKDLETVLVVCVNKHYPATYEEGKIKSIGGIAGKISAAVEKGCDTIVIPKSNSSDYRDEVPLSIRTKVKKLHKVENYEDLKNLFLAGL